MEDLTLLREGARSALRKLLSVPVELAPHEMEGLRTLCFIGGLLSHIDAGEMGRLQSAQDAQALLEALADLADLSIDRHFRIVYGI